MATITTTIITIDNILPYEGVGEVLQQRSDFARAEITHTRRDQTIAATGAGDDSFVVIDGILPANFAYTLTDLYFSIESAAGVTNSYDPTCGFFLMDSLSTGALRTWELHLPNFARAGVNGATGTEILAYHFESMPQMVMRPASGQQLGYQLGVFNPVQNLAAHLCNFYARFQQFDINQAIHVAVNTQLPVRAR